MERNTMEQHIKILGIIYIVYSAFFLIAAWIVFITLAGAGVISGDEEAMAITAIVATAISVFFIITALPGLIGGIGLLKYQPWARWLVLILGFIKLLNVPIGTVLGAYTIWSLMNEDMARFYKAKMSGAA